MSKKKIALLITILLIIDQVVKIWIKTNMTLDQSFLIFPDWFYIRFLENPGAAFGMQLGGDYGKLALSLFRVCAIGALIWYLNRLIKTHAPKGVLIGFALIVAGAIGNMIDSAFYGMIFSASTWSEVASFLPEGGGYAGFLHGKVVDMLYFPIFTVRLYDWLPVVGGNDFTFFSPIFNIADSYISVAVIYLILFERKYFK